MASSRWSRGGIANRNCRGASVWDAKTQEMAIEVEGTTYVGAVDISPDSTRFATGPGYGTDTDESASIWNILTGERLVGPLKHHGAVGGVRFSPDGEHIATVCPSSICVFDSHNGNQLIKINNQIFHTLAGVTPLAWSSNGQQIFAVSNQDEIKSFDVSTGSQLAELQVQHGGDVDCIALASNGKFLATFAGRSITFWDTSTLTQIGPAIEDSQSNWSIALSLDSSHLATGGSNGSITIRNLSNILPDSYGPFLAPTQEPESEIPKDQSQQQDEQPSTFGDHDNKQQSDSDLTSDNPTRSSRPESETHREGSEGDLLEVELPSSTAPAPLFDYEDPPSPASCTGPREVDVMPSRSMQAAPQLPGPLSFTSPPETSAKKHPDTPGSPKGISALERWLPARFRKTNTTRSLQPPDQLATSSGPPIDVGFSSQPRSRENTPKRGPPTIAAGQRVRRAVAKPVNWNKGNTKTAKVSHQNATSSGQGSAGTKGASTVQQGNEPFQPSAMPGVHVTQEASKAKVSIAFMLPAWMLCLRSDTEDGVH